MKLSFIPLVALLSAIPAAMALPATTTVAEPPSAPTVWSGASTEAVPSHELTKRDVQATVRVDGLRYRTCPRTGCPAMGQYPIHTHIRLQCYTRDNTTPVHGDRGWAKVSNGYWVALAWGRYVSWSGQIPYCH